MSNFAKVLSRMNPICVAAVAASSGPSVFAGLSYWNNTIYTWPSSTNLRSYTITGSPVATGMETSAAEQGLPVSISASFDDANSGLLWSVVPDNGDPHSNLGDPDHFVTGHLSVYNAYTLQLLQTYSLGTNNIMKFTPPLVANGRVYVVTPNQRVLVWGR